MEWNILYVSMEKNMETKSKKLWKWNGMENTKIMAWNCDIRNVNKWNGWIFNIDSHW